MGPFFYARRAPEEIKLEKSMKRDNIDGKIESLVQDINHKFDLIIESTELLRGDIRELDRKAAERFEVINFKFDAMINKLDNVSAGLSVHRADT